MMSIILDIDKRWKSEAELGFYIFFQTNNTHNSIVLQSYLSISDYKGHIFSFDGNKLNIWIINVSY